MPTRVSIRAIVLAALLCAGVAPGAAAEPAEFLPVGSASYDEIEVLVARGLLDSLRIYTRPLVRVDIAHALLRARRLHEDLPKNLSYQRLEREFARELSDLGQPPDRHETGPLVDVGPKESRFRIQSAAHVRGDYDETRDGAHFRFRDETAVGVRAGLQLWPAFGAYEDIAFTRIRERSRVHRPDRGAHRRRGRRAPRGDDGAGRRRHRGRRVRRVSMGAGPTGHACFSPTRPGRWDSSCFRETPWAVSRRPRCRAFSRDAEDRMFAAHRLEFAATRRLTLGLAEAVRYSNNGIDLLYGIGIIPYTLIERIHVREASNDSVRAAERSNVMVSTDAAFRLSPGLTLYGEFLVDDFTTEDTSMPDRFGWQAGLRSDRPLGNGMIHFLAEYARVRNFTYSVYYDENFIYRERPLGYVLGPDVEDLWLEVGYDLSRDWQLRWSGDFVNKGEGRIGEAWYPAMGPVSNSSLSGVVEEAREVWGDLRWLPRDNVDLSAGVGYRRRENVNNQSGVDETAWLLRMAAELRY